MPFHIADVTMLLSASGGGVRRYLEQKRAWLQLHTECRHDIVAPVPSMPDTILVPGIPLPFSNGYKFVVRRSACASVLENLRPDIIETGDPYRLAWAALDAGHALNVPTVAFCHSNVERLAAENIGRLAAKSVQLYLRRLYARFDLVLAPSEWMRRHLADSGISNVVRQPLGVDTRTFHPLRRDPLWRVGLGLPADACVLIYVGRFSAEKHLDVLCDTVKRLGEPYHLVLIGSGPVAPSGPRVIVIPFESDIDAVARAIASADAFVHAGDQETFGLAALEALACGIPLVARDCAGLGELASPDLGIPVTGGRSEDFAEAIVELFSRLPREGLMLRRNARRVAECHEWKNIMPRLMNRYTRVLAEHRRRCGAAHRLSLRSL